MIPTSTPMDLDAALAPQVAKTHVPPLMPKQPLLPLSQAELDAISSRARGAKNPHAAIPLSANSVLRLVATIEARTAQRDEALGRLKGITSAPAYGNPARRNPDVGWGGGGQ